MHGCTTRTISQSGDFSQVKDGQEWTDRMQTRGEQRQVVGRFGPKWPDSEPGEQEMVCMMMFLLMY
jgi:hypothetical protein